MFITVKYRNGKHGIVEDSKLGELVRSNEVEKFIGLEGWVPVGVDLIRNANNCDKSPDKRRPPQISQGTLETVTRPPEVAPEIRKDKRREKRFALNAEASNGQIIFAADARIIDISSEGLRLKTRKQLKIGAQYVLKLEDTIKVIPLKGTVVWSLLCETKPAGGEVVPIYTSGMKFTNMPSENTAELLNLIEGYKREGVHLADRSKASISY